MKQSDLSHPLLLITIGAPGTGKSTFAKQLAQHHHFAWVHTNRLRSTIFPQPSFSKHEESVVEELAEAILDEMLRTKGNIIYDGNANARVSRAKYIRKAHEAGYKVLLVWLQTDAETARARAAKRGNRLQDDQFATSLSQDTFDYFAHQFTRPIASESYVVISGKHAFPTQARTLVAKLQGLYGKPQVEVKVRSKATLKKPEPQKTTEPQQQAPGKPKTLPSLEDIHHAPQPKERPRSRVDITRHIKFR